MLQNLKNENKENTKNNNDKNSNEIQDTKIKDNNTNIILPFNIGENYINDELINNLLRKSDKSNKLQFKINQSYESNSIDNVKQDIINFYLIEKEKYEEKKREIETNKNFNSSNYNTKSKISTPNYNSTKRFRPNSANKDIKNRFEKYDRERISYEVYHQYQKLNFNFSSIPFIQRMELYSLKRCLKDYKIEELTNLQSPKISEKEIIQTFNRLIEDSNRRLFKSQKISNRKNNKIIEKKGIPKEKKIYNKKKWDEIYEKRFGSKLKERNDKIEKKRKEKEEKIKKEEDTIIDNLNKKQELFNKRYGMKRNKSANNMTKSSNQSLNSNNKYYIGNRKIITNLNQRLYYNEMNKKDYYYKSFVEKAKELIDKELNNMDKKANKKLNTNINGFRKRGNRHKNRNIQKSNSVYNFSAFEEKNREEEKNNNNNFENILKEDIDLRISETSIANNSKVEITGSASINNKGRNESAEKIIDRFFEN